MGWRAGTQQRREAAHRRTHHRCVFSHPLAVVALAVVSRLWRQCGAGSRGGAEARRRGGRRRRHERINPAQAGRQAVCWHPPPSSSKAVASPWNTLVIWDSYDHDRVACEWVAWKTTNVRTNGGHHQEASPAHPRRCEAQPIHCLQQLCAPCLSHPVLVVSSLVKTKAVKPVAVKPCYGLMSEGSVKCEGVSEWFVPGLPQEPARAISIPATKPSGQHIHLSSQNKPNITHSSAPSLSKPLASYPYCTSEMSGVRGGWMNDGAHAAQHTHMQMRCWQ